MIREADVDGDGQINYDGAHSLLSSRPHLLNVAPVTYDAEFVKVHIVDPFHLIICLLIVIDVDDAGQVITPRHLVRSRISVSSLLSIICMYGPEQKSTMKVVDIMCISIMRLSWLSIHVSFLNRDRLPPHFIISLIHVCTKFEC